MEGTGEEEVKLLSIAIPLESLQHYLVNVVSSLLDISDSRVLERSFISSSALLLQFISDSTCQRIYIQQLNLPDLSFDYSVITDLVYSTNMASLVAVVKMSAVVTKNGPLANQLQVVVLPAGDSNPYEVLHSYVHHVVSPFFDAFTSSKDGALSAANQKREDKDAKLGIPSTKKKMAELELSLKHLQQNIEIPEVILNVHPIIKSIVDECHKNGTTPSVLTFSAETLNDSLFLNELQNEVNNWIKEIQKVSRLSREPANGTAIQEINFWLGMEKELGKIEEKLKEEAFSLTLDVLKHAKRFHATVSFFADTGLKEAMERVHKYNLLMKEFPLNELLSATDMEKVRDSLSLIFVHLSKKLRISPYPIRKALQLVEAISQDFNDQLLKVIGGRRLMHLPYHEFEKISNLAEQAFFGWEELVKEFTNVAREITRKRSEKFIPIKITAVHGKLQTRINYLRTFRKQHEQLYATILKVLKPEGGVEIYGSSDEVGLAFDSLKTIDVLDVSPEGTEIWAAAEAAYNVRVSRVENQIITILKNRLANAKGASEMFRVFSKFNALFVRPKIRGAIQEYQNQLVESVKRDIFKLQEKFKQQYYNSDANRVSTIRDMPPVSGTIIWAKQLDRQLTLYMKRVEDVLGRGWELYTEGQKLQNESRSFRRKLDSKKIFDQWLSETMKKDLTVSGRIFDIHKDRTRDNILVIQICFEKQVILLFKEVRNLLALGFHIPHTIINIAKDAKRVYPFAVSLMDTLRTYNSCLDLLNANNAVSPLLVSYRKDVRERISKGITQRWDYFVNILDARLGGISSGQEQRENRHVNFVREISTVMSIFQDKLMSAIDLNNRINEILDELRVCPYSKDEFGSRLETIQEMIDKLNLESYSNLEYWVHQLNTQLEGIFINRLKDSLNIWIKAFYNDFNKSSSNSRKMVKRSSVGENTITEQTEIIVKITPIVHEIKLKNQTMYIDPPLEYSRHQWYIKLHEWLAIICAQKRLMGSRYEAGLQTKKKFTKQNDNYENLLLDIGSSELLSAYDKIEQKIVAAQNYVFNWLQYQSLWDLSADFVYSQLNDDLSKWQQLLTEIKNARDTFDTSETAKAFGPIVIDYEQVQYKVNAKYDSWQREILNKSGQYLGIKLKEFCHVIAAARNELEGKSLESSSTTDAVSFVIYVDELCGNVDTWKESVSLFSSGEKVLERQRFQFPNDWLYAEQVSSEWGAFFEILCRKKTSIEKNMDELQSRVSNEDEAISNNINEIIEEWNAVKPVQAHLNPKDALAVTADFDKRMSEIFSKWEKIAKAKEALNLSVSKNVKLEPSLEELHDLNVVWKSLSLIWEGIDELQETMWNTIAPRKIRLHLDQLYSNAKNLPNNIRQYAAYEFLMTKLKDYIQSNILITELKSDAIRDRHWKQIFKYFQLNKMNIQELSLGDVWKLELKKNEKFLSEIIHRAQGELALELFLSQVRETWSNYALELVNYQNKCRILKGWDDIFTKCGDHLNSLHAMKYSPYYKIFEEEALTWNEKLNRVQMLFDVWIDVQRQWVYLESIFSGNSDIKHLLPVESTRFNNINSEFMAVMKKVYKLPFILDVINIPNIQKSLERLGELLNKIQKALGEYLERERACFSRFYFVGDEDLLEIVGNSKDVTRVQKHFKKMFSGVSSVILNESGDTISGVTSSEDEFVQFKNPVTIKDKAKINLWLAALEKEIKVSLSLYLRDSLQKLTFIYDSPKDKNAKFSDWIDEYPAQICILALQIQWTSKMEESISDKQKVEMILENVNEMLNMLAISVLQDLKSIKRRKCESVIIELVRERDIIKNVITENDYAKESFIWQRQLRYYHISSAEFGQDVIVKMANAEFEYGYEYLGAVDRLVHTPLTDKCYLTLTQALQSRLGGSPFGPAGTGKTESVKALGAHLGRFVLVFNCDDTFDFQAMGRIFIGICTVGAWGCFDEFNRLEERILSAVSQQIQTIQYGLKQQDSIRGKDLMLLGKSVHVSPKTGIFITMNPDYAGRSNLPDNLKKLFRSIAMVKPDKELITQVTLYSHGFQNVEKLSKKVITLFHICSEQLSAHSHYDFGLRALKSVLSTAGSLKRQMNIEKGRDLYIFEQEIIIKSIENSLLPKLTSEDIPSLKSLLLDVFPGITTPASNLEELQEVINAICSERLLIPGKDWILKMIQLYQVIEIHHGLIMVGPSGSGKSTAWKTLFDAMNRIDKIEGMYYLIDPKSVSKEALYGTLDPNTREWNDGIFTNILRKIIQNVRGEGLKRHWIIFDGDVDPEWVENLNSVLDDNRLLTLPNGERLYFPSNVRVLFEVQDLEFATPATITRCGMVWFSKSIISTDMLIQHYLMYLKRVSLRDMEDGNILLKSINNNNDELEPSMQVQQLAISILEPYFATGGFVDQALAVASDIQHIMTFLPERVLGTLFSLVNQTIRNVIDFNNDRPDFPMTADHLSKYIGKRFTYCLVWSFVGDAPNDIREYFCDILKNLNDIDMPNGSILNFDVDINSGDWTSWSNKVPLIDIETHSVVDPDLVIPTIDTVRNEELIYSWVADRKPLILCGPPGSGKTMSLFSALRKLSDIEVIGLNFSSATTPEAIQKTLEQHCEYRKSPEGVILAPVLASKWLVVFCDEINLPARDKYGTQGVISFLRQVIEQNGFWNAKERIWVKLHRIQIVGACNPPSDPGRIPLSHRFLRHTPVIMMDHPIAESLGRIYGTFNKAVLKLIPSLRAYSQPLTDAMVEFYNGCSKRFTSDSQVHYIYSPRELTRWVRGIYEALKPLDDLDLGGLVRLWGHEGLRLFQDRLVSKGERDWIEDYLDKVALKYFPGILSSALARPILYSNWLSRHYVSVDRKELRDFVNARLKIFYEEELDVPLVLSDHFLEHALRIDRIFSQPQGHLLLIGMSGSGKTTLARFVAWMNGYSITQINIHNNYTGLDFDEDLKSILRRCGCKGEKVCFIMDESNVMESSFLERMNTLLANADIPGLFEGEELTSLMAQCKEYALKDGILVDSADELHKWFKQQVMKNLHVVFTMNPPEEGFTSRAATSPALLNRCVIDWFGNWPSNSYYQVGKELTDHLDLDINSYIPPDSYPKISSEYPLPSTHREAIISNFVFVHSSIEELTINLKKKSGNKTFITPRHFLDFISQFSKMYVEKREELEDLQRHVNVGLQKLNDTVEKVEILRKSLAIKKNELEIKTGMANEKLKSMVKDQQEAEKEKVISVKIQTNLEEKNAKIDERRKVVMNDLAKAEPAVIEAQNSVSSIKKQHLTEVRTMGNPPQAVKLALEAACTLLGHKVESWKSVQSMIRRDDFIANIVNFNTERQMNSALRERMQEFTNDANFNFEVVNRASKACGPLVQWVIAQVNYSEILERVGPLRKEVDELEKEAAEISRKAAETEKVIATLEGSIARYKEEYAVLISETQSLKREMEEVQSKVDRSVTLVNSLSSEKDRWVESNQSFEVQLATLFGDVLIASAFVCYAGYFDQQQRESMLRTWTTQLQDSGIKFRAELSIIEFLSSADERLKWQEAGLPNDSLCIENAIMLNRPNRYPLIIDPSGQSLSFIKKMHSGSKLTITSFLDNAFVKTLESALRFGNTVLIQDVDQVDPILNSILNKEVKRAGGRVLIRLGNQEVDFSISFKLFLATRNPSATFPPDICSRVMLVNFSVTKSSLYNQCINEILRVERPDIDERRRMLMKLQGEYQVRLRHLEQLLLKSLNESEGNILDDDQLITTLEQLKKEASDIQARAKETSSIMEEVEETTMMYKSLGDACSAIYGILEQLNRLNLYYQFSLDFFKSIFFSVLENNVNLNNVKDYIERLHILQHDIFKMAFQRVVCSILFKDIYVIGLLFAHAKLTTVFGDANNTYLTDLLLEDEIHGKTSTVSPGESPIVQLETVLKKWGKQLDLESVSYGFASKKSQWLQLLESNNIDATDEILEEKDEMKVLSLKVLLAKSFIPTSTLSTIAKFVEGILGFSIFSFDLDLQSVACNEINEQTAIAICSIPGYDASDKVENLARQLSKRVHFVAMGSNESIQLAENAIRDGCKNGDWVLLKNVHLSFNWMSQLEKKIRNLKSRSGFRLFYSIEMVQNISVNLLRQSRVLVFEPPPGIKASLHIALKDISPQRLENTPIEKGRLYFLLAWLQAIIQERLRYIPLGWSKAYEFSDADREWALSMIDDWIQSVGHQRTNISPNKIPWQALQNLISICVYGGRMDNDFDFLMVEAFVKHLFRSQAFGSNFNLSLSDDDTVPIPDCTQLSQFLEWINELPATQPPTWLGLATNAESLLLSAKGTTTLLNFKEMMSTIYSHESVMSVFENAVETSTDSNPTWLKLIHENVEKWLSLLPEGIEVNETEVGSSNPLIKCFTREKICAKECLKIVRQDLYSVLEYLKGNGKVTNDIRNILSYIKTSIIPEHWKFFKSIKNTSLGTWIPDLLDRINYVQTLGISSLTGIQLGRLFRPGTYFTATRQYIAQQSGMPLEELEFSILLSNTLVENGFLLEGLQLHGATSLDNKIVPCQQDSTTMTGVYLVWEKQQETLKAENTMVSIPIYLNSDRTECLLVAKLFTEEKNVRFIQQQAVAFTL